LGRIPPEYLPPREAWPERVSTLPEFRAYPQQLNSTEELLDRHEREIVDSCRDALAVYKLPREMVFVDSVPRAPGPAGPSTGKLLRRVLRHAAV